MMKPDTSNLMDTILTWYQNVAGFSSPILGNHSYDIYYINSRWFYDLII